MFIPCLSLDKDIVKTANLIDEENDDEELEIL